MVRLLLSFAAAALGSSAIWYLLVALASHQPIGVDSLRTIAWLGLVILCASLVLGLPTLPLVRRYSLTSYWQVVGLAMAVIMGLLTLAVLVALSVAVFDGASIRQLFGFSVDDVMVPFAFLASMGFLGGSFIWLVGVRGNPYFVDQ